MSQKLIQIFTDGGAFKYKSIAVSVGLICIDGKNALTFKKFIEGKNSNYSEIFAIKKAISRSYGMISQMDDDTDYCIEVYTDSLISINIINSALLGEEINYVYDYLVKEIVELINKIGEDKISFFHIKSHVGTKWIKRNYYEFCIENSCNISLNKFIFIYQQNKKCDKIVKSTYKQMKKITTNKK